MKRGDPEPGQRLPDRFRLAPRTLPERLDQHAGVEKIEHNCDGTSIEFRDSDLLVHFLVVNHT